jgi:hypothetical protein
VILLPQEWSLQLLLLSVALRREARDEKFASRFTSKNVGIFFFFSNPFFKMPSVEEQLVLAMKENQQYSSVELDDAGDAQEEAVDAQDEAVDGQEEAAIDGTEAVEFEQVPEKASGMSNTITRLLSVSTPNPEVS